jgi:DNA ligase (NAD+)
VEDVGEVTAKAVSEWFANPLHREIVARLRMAGLQMSGQWSVVSGQLDGMTFVVSGVFEHFSREEIKADIENHGGKVSGSISGKTTYLLAGEKMGPEKLKKAEKLGVKILSESEYLEMR